MILALAAIGFALALLPAACFFRNLRLYAPPRMPEEVEAARLPGVSVLIPARNEAGTIREAVLAALVDQGVAGEVVVLDAES
ncbi:MAG: glycosyl transferase, partial [Planctomycetota bacterium]